MGSREQKTMTHDAVAWRGYTLTSYYDGPRIVCMSASGGAPIGCVAQISFGGATSGEQRGDTPKTALDAAYEALVAAACVFVEPTSLQGDGGKGD